MTSKIKLIGDFDRKEASTLKGKKTKEQLLEELIELQNSIGQKVETQDSFIRRFKLLVQNESLFTKVIDNFPYPIAIFDRNGVLSIANKMLLKETNIDPGDVAAGRINFLNCITNENYPVLEAVEDIFLGETTVLNDMVEPLSLFSREYARRASANFQSAVFFPVAENHKNIRHGAVMFMK